jgi:hypothetical protein
MTDDADLIAVTHSQRYVVEGPYHHTLFSVSGTPEQTFDGAAEQRFAQARLGPVDRELGHHVLKYYFNQCTGSDS